MVAGNRADRAADVDDFGGSELRGKRGDDLRASHGELHVAEAQKGMAAEINLICADRGDGARGTDRRVALHQDHASHVAWEEMTVIGLGCGGAALSGDEPVTLKLASELAKGFGLIAGENERGLDGLQRRAGWQTRARSRLLRERELLARSIGRDALRRGVRRRMNDVLDGVTPPMGSLVKTPSFSESAPASLPSK